MKNCIALLTVIPVRNIKPTDDFLQPMLLVAGVIQAIGSTMLAFRNSNADLILYIAIKRLIQGCIYEDGLADLADASGVYNKHSKLSAIKDPKTGVLGTLALFLTLSLEYTLLKPLNNIKAIKTTTACALIGYSSMLWHWMCLPHAYDTHKLVLRKTNVLMCTAITVTTLFVCYDFVRASAIMIQTICLNVWFNKWSLTNLGGKTGDTLGAIKLLSETLSMICLSA
ncbi:adenosylcobinamide-GDP ribazoletransferase [Candidatus Hodgkinia cicadicola]